MKDQSYCQYKVQEGLSIYVTLATLLLTFGLVIPLKIVLTLFFDGILRAPTSIAKSDASSKVDDSAVPSAVRRASRVVMNIGSTLVKKN